ncbi:MAG: hypothetical protein JSV88_26935 [Candidatus Aminicenantes bacterium]|nr:MAG: hypothetical protein JSV88_26935 [Candidatus Aminicenantes bacterium]
MDFDSLAKILKGTKRKKRDINLLEVSKELKNLHKNYNSLTRVAEVVKLSPEMVREFLKINELEKEVKELIKLNKISSIDTSYRLSKIRGNDQILLAKEIVSKNLSSDDVRGIVKFKIDNPGIPIEKVIHKVLESKDKKIYVAYLQIEEKTFEKFSEKIKEKNKEEMIKSIFDNFIDPEHISSFDLNGRVVILKISRQGSKEIRNKAKELKVPLAKLADVLVNEYLDRTKQ